MEGSSKVIGIELEYLEHLLTKIVTEQNGALLEELKQLLHRKDNPLDNEHITTKQLMVELGVTRNTIQNYRRSGLLPPPNFDLSDRPYWTAEQLKSFFEQRKARGKFPE